MRYSFTFNNQNINLPKDFFYYRINLESSGNLLAAIDNSPFFEQVDSHKELLGIRYAQFFRIDQDIRYYKVLSQENRLAFRTIIGLGIPYGNSSELPFERSFYAGGANGMRGWQFRQLGPGSYTDTLNIERIGDIHLEFNAEYRFPIYDYLKGALFVDVGNIWTLRERENLPGGEFRLDRFYKDLAVDAGIGFRFDFSFFIFRLDAATPLRDPALSQGNRWVFDQINLRNLVWNFGIGYPF
jgi:outer membrane protein assembly factor BamA